MSLVASAAMANADELTVGQLQTIAIPKRSDTAVTPVSLGGLKTGGGLQAVGTRASTAVPAPLSGLSLQNLSLVPTSANSTTSSDGSGASVTQQNGNIMYSVIPDAGFTPYLGIGAGRATGLLNPGLSHPTPYDSSDSLHSYQGLAGFAYKLDKDTSLDFDYRMSNTQRPNVPMLDNANIADSGRDRAAILSLHYDLDPVLTPPHQ